MDQEQKQLGDTGTMGKPDGDAAGVPSAPRRRGRSFVDYTFEAVEVPRVDPVGDEYRVRRALASLIARQIVAKLRGGACD